MESSLVHHYLTSLSYTSTSSPLIMILSVVWMRSTRRLVLCFFFSLSLSRNYFANSWGLDTHCSNFQVCLAHIRCFGSFLRIFFPSILWPSFQFLVLLVLSLSLSHSSPHAFPLADQQSAHARSVWQQGSLFLIFFGGVHFRVVVVLSLNSANLLQHRSQFVFRPLSLLCS